MIPGHQAPSQRARLGLFLFSVLFLLALAPGLLIAQDPPGFSAAWEKVSAELRDTLDAAGMVGSSWAFVKDGDFVARAHHGFADVETGRRVDEETIFHWGSITKTLTGIAVLQLRDRGLLSLDDPIVDYVPEVAAAHNPFGNMEDITLRQLLSHSAGFRNSTWPWGGGEAWHPHEPRAWEQLVAMMPYTEILFEPGSRFAYSNPGIVFLGETIERVAHEEWEVYVEKNILRPLGMHRSYFDHTPYHLLAYRSNNYFVSDGIPTANGLDFDTGITVSNGGLNAPLGDMGLYLGFLTGTGPGAMNGSYETVLARETLEEMWQLEVPIQDGAPLRESMGLTFFREEYEGALHIGHTGSQKAFFSFIYVDPATGAGAIAAFNAAGVGRPDTARPATRTILNQLRESFFAEIFPLFR